MKIYSFFTVMMQQKLEKGTELADINNYLSFSTKI
jgi:hypothetical protein